MKNIVNFCCIIIIVLAIFQSKIMKSSSSGMAKMKISTCWSYATNQDNHLQGVFPTNIGYTNKRTGVTKGLIYSNDKKVCNSVCEKNRFGTSCYYATSYDIDFKIPKNSYVCWFDQACPRHADKKLYTEQDTDIFHNSKYRCGFLCDSIYGQDGRCMKRVLSVDEKKKNVSDYKYYCFYQKLAPIK